MRRSILVVMLFAILVVLLFVPSAAQAQFTTVRVSGTVVNDAGAPVQYARVTIFRQGNFSWFSGSASATGYFEAVGYMDGNVDGTWQYLAESLRHKVTRGTVNVTGAQGAAGDIVLERELIVTLAAIAQPGSDGKSIIRWFVDAYPIPGTNTVPRKKLVIRAIVIQPTERTFQSQVEFSQRLPLQGPASMMTEIPLSPPGTFISGRITVTLKSDPKVILSDSHGFSWMVGSGQPPQVY